MATVVEMDENWITLVPAARLLAIHPESLRRKWLYGELPEGVCRKLGRVLYFDSARIQEMANA